MKPRMQSHLDYPYVLTESSCYSFLQIRKSAVLYLPMDYVFSIYLVFIISAIIAYTWRFIRIIRNGVPEEKPALNIKEDVT